MKPKLMAFWQSVAWNVAMLSTCERTQVGCLLLSPDGERMLAMGYNGGVRGGSNVPPTDVPGTDFWVHAEQNALCKSRPFEPFICLCTHTPCYRCAQLLINSGCSRVFAMKEYRDLSGWQLLLDHGKGEMIS